MNSNPTRIVVAIVAVVVAAGIGIIMLTKHPASSAPATATATQWRAANGDRMAEGTAQRTAAEAANGRGMRGSAPDAQALADLQAKVTARQDKKETSGETTIDLKLFVNCQLTAPLAGRSDVADYTMAELPSGAHVYGGVPFDVSGLVQLRGDSVADDSRAWPAEVKGIPIDRSFKKLHLFHSAFNIDAPGQHETFARMVLHYADGSQKDLELAGGMHALRCVGPAAPPMLRIVPWPQTELGWLGFNPRLQQDGGGQALHIYRTTLDNPNPDAKVTSIDYVSAGQNPAPFLAGLTVE